MPLSPQPPGHKGTADEPYSPLNLRLALALFGLVACPIAAIVLRRLDFIFVSWMLVLFAFFAAVDLVVIQLRRRARRRSDPRRHSLFE